MTDFFDDLDTELRAAHRRDTARPLLAGLRALLPRRGAVLAMAGAAAVLVAAVLAVAGLLDTVREDDAAVAPVATQPVACDDREPPAEVLEALAVLRKPGDELSEVPGTLLTLSLAEGDAAKLWPDAARLARGEGDSRILVAPALLGDSCERPAPAGRERVLLPGACLFDIGGEEFEDPACVTLADIRAGKPALVIESGSTIYPLTGPEEQSAGRTTVFAIVPDGREAHVRAGDRVIDGSTENNVLTASYTPASADEPEPRVVLGPDAPAAARGGCTEPAPASEGNVPVPERFTATSGLWRRPPTGADELTPALAQRLAADGAMELFRDGVRVLAGPGGLVLTVAFVRRFDLTYARRCHASATEPPDVGPVLWTWLEGPGEPGEGSTTPLDGVRDVAFAFFSPDPADADRSLVVGLVPDGAAQAIVEVGGERLVFDVDGNRFAGRTREAGTPDDPYEYVLRVRRPDGSERTVGP